MSRAAVRRDSNLPLNSRLATGRPQASFGLSLPPWQTGVERMLTEIHGR